jgi:hypothetical protein
MPHRALARSSARVAGCLAASVLALAGCADDPASEPSSTSTSASAESASASPSDNAPSSDSTAEPSTSASTSVAPGGSTLRSRLLAAAELPGFNPDFRWTQGPTAPEDPSASFGTCQRFAVTSIGAERALVRRFRPADDGSTDRAGELVATFADTQTARRAFSVLEAWRRQCADRLRAWQQSDVGPLEDVVVTGGRGGWYLLTYGPVPGDRDSQFFDAQGMALVGSRIAMVSMVAAGQDYDYDAGSEPMVAAVQRAAQKLS